MGIGTIVEWTKSKLSQLASEGSTVMNADSQVVLATGTVATPSLDLFESEQEYRVILDAPGAVPATTCLSWNGIDTLLIHVRRAATDVGAPSVCEFREADWFREVVLPADANGAKASAEIRNGVVSIRVPKRLTLSSTLLPVFAA